MRGWQSGGHSWPYSWPSPAHPDTMQVGAQLAIQLALSWSSRHYAGRTPYPGLSWPSSAHPDTMQVGRTLYPGQSWPYSWPSPAHPDTMQVGHPSLGTAGHTAGSLLLIQTLCR